MLFRSPTTTPYTTTTTTPYTTPTTTTPAPTTNTPYEYKYEQKYKEPTVIYTAPIQSPQPNIIILPMQGPYSIPAGPSTSTSSSYSTEPTPPSAPGEYVVKGRYNYSARTAEYDKHEVSRPQPQNAPAVYSVPSVYQEPGLAPTMHEEWKPRDFMSKPYENVAQNDHYNYNDYRYISSTYFEPEPEPPYPSTNYNYNYPETQNRNPYSSVSMPLP